MLDTYLELGQIWENHSISRLDETARAIIDVLEWQGISLRKKDGQLRQVTLSKPKTVEVATVVGLRYEKNDRTHSEDHFLAKPESPVESYYRGTLQNLWPEYHGTHKQSVPHTPFNVLTGATCCNTLTIVLGTAAATTPSSPPPSSQKPFQITFI